MRRPLGWPTLALAVATLSATAAVSPAAESKARPKPATVEAGTTRAYQVLGALPVMHNGRVKPLDTVAREEIKSIYTRETIQLASEDGSKITSWTPVAAFLDWSVRPKFWDAQAIISVEYLPLKQLLLADEVRGALEDVARKSSTSEPDRAKLKATAELTEIDAGALRSVVRETKLPEADALKLEDLARKVGEETKWLSPEDLESAEVAVEGKSVPFLSWIQELIDKERKASMTGGKSESSTSEIEGKALEVARRLVHYRAIRDKESLGAVPLLVVPRPSNKAMIEFSGKSMRKAMDEGRRSLDPFEMEVAANLNRYLEDVPGRDQRLPGEDAEFDARYATWLKERAPWLPLGTIREVDVEELAAAGFEASKVEAFRAAFKAMEEEELTRPGQANEAPALALAAAARGLGESVNAIRYPSPAEMTREVHFNDFAPFLKAPVVYFLGALILIFSLVAKGQDAPTNRISGFARLSKGFYLAGVGVFASGILLEAYGFYLRVRISGWAPVTNMYETVIWVAMVLSILGFALEMVYRKTYAALAGSLAALLGTGLAASVPMLEEKSGIGTLPPVLRSNYWLTIHVLTIVSSYAAFALAWMLGLIATSIYLTTTYKRSARFGELASPLLIGPPLLALGVAGYFASYGKLGAGDAFQQYGFWPSVVVGSVGGLIAMTGVFALFGEAINRRFLRISEIETGDDSLAGPTSAAGTTSGLAAAPKPSPRAEAMRETAALIKPIANFIYRSMQVGILLVTAGTFLGGWWADVSWGRFWGWDPKEVWALITLLVYLIPLHGRFAGWVNTFWLVMASVACFLSVLMAWYGVNFVLGVGLHSYGFTKGGSQGTVGIATLLFLSYATGAWWRRAVSQKV